MADQVQIKLGADTRSAVSGLKEFQAAVESSTASIQTLSGPSGIGSIISSSQTAIETINGIRSAVALGFSTGPMIAFTGVMAAVAFTMKEAIGLVDDLIEKTHSLNNLRSSAFESLASYNKQLKKAVEEGLISEDEFYKKGAIANDQSFLGGKPPDEQAKEVAKLVAELRNLLEIRRRILADREATKKADGIEFDARLKRQTSESGGIEANDRRILNAGFMSPSSFESRQKENAKQVLDAQIQVINEKDKQLKAQLEKADRSHAIVLNAQRKALDAERFEAEQNFQNKVIAIEEETSAKVRAMKEAELQKQINIRDTQRKLEAERLAQIDAQNEAIREGFEIERARIAGDFRLTDNEKRRLTMESLTAQNSMPGVASKRSQQQLGFLQADADPNSMKDQTIKAMVELKSAMGTTAQNISQVFVSPIQGAFTGLQGSIAGLIKGTMTWKDAMRNVAASIVEQLVSAIAMLIAKAIILTAVITALNVIAPGLGSALGFAAGGIGARASGGIAGPGLYQVGERGPEYVVNNQTLNRMGGGFFDSLQAGYTPPQAAGGGGSSNVHIGFIGGPSMVGQWLETREGRAYVANIADQQIREARG